VDPALSMHDNEHQAFSMRPERVVRYRITVHTQWSDRGHVVFSDSGILIHSFRLTASTNTSRVLFSLLAYAGCHACKFVSSEIYSNRSRNLLNNFFFDFIRFNYNRMFPSPAMQSDAVKY